MRRSRILGVGHYLPERVVTNDELTAVMDTTDEWIQQRTGIRERRYSEGRIGAADLGANAARVATDAQSAAIGGASSSLREATAELRGATKAVVDAAVRALTADGASGEGQRDEITEGRANHDHSGTRPGTTGQSQLGLRTPQRASRLKIKCSNFTLTARCIHAIAVYRQTQTQAQRLRTLVGDRGRPNPLGLESRTEVSQLRRLIDVFVFRARGYNQHRARNQPTS